MTENEITLNKIDNVKKQIEDLRKKPICRRFKQISELLDSFNEVLDDCKKSIESKEINK